MGQKTVRGPIMLLATHNKPDTTGNENPRQCALQRTAGKIVSQALSTEQLPGPGFRLLYLLAHATGRHLLRHQ